MKIVYHTDQIYLHGGIEKIMADKANFIASLPGYKVYILTSEQSDKIPCYCLDKRVHLIDLEINYNREDKYFSFNNIKKAFNHLIKQRKILKKIKPDVVITPNFYFDFYWMPFICRKAKKVKEIHSSQYNQKSILQQKFSFSKMNQIFKNFIINKYDHIVVLNEDEKKYFNNKNVAVIPNFIKTEKHVKCSLLNKKVLSAGRITKVKGFDQLIKAWCIVHQHFPEWELDLYGEDYQGTQEELMKLINSSQLSEVVNFKGSVSNLSETMLDYSIYAMSSRTECFPMVLLEALSVGLPIVSYDCPNGPRNIITNQIDGFLIKHQSHENLAEKLMDLMSDMNLRIQMGSKGKINVNRLSEDKIMYEWITLFKQK